MHPHQLHEIRIGDEPAAWEDAGFTVTDGAVTVGRTRLVLVGHDAGRGIRSVAVDGVDGDTIDGVALHAGRPAQAAPPHPNGVDHVDHLVVMSDDPDRTTAALEALGIQSRRVRTFPMGGVQRRQTFFWLGDVILELVGPDTATGDDPAHAWGLALSAPDLDHTAAVLDGRCSPPKDAVQPGRRITTIATRALDISTALAVMTPHPRSQD